MSNIKQINFVFVDIVSSIFLLLLMLVNFLGLLYVTGGNYPISLLISILIVVIYYFTLQMLKRYKEKIVNQKYLHPATLFFLVFLIGGVGSIILASHAWNIEKNVKAEIQSDANHKINELKKIPNIYSEKARTNLLDFEGQLTSNINNYKKSQDSELRNILMGKPFEIDSVVLSTPTYMNTDTIVSIASATQGFKVSSSKTDIKNKIELPLNDYLETFNGWELFKIMPKYKSLNQFYTDSYNLLNEKIQELPIEEFDVRFEPPKPELPLSKPFELNKIYKPDYLIPSSAIFIGSLFILIPFFTHKIRINPIRKREEGERNGAYII